MMITPNPLTLFYEERALIAAFRQCNARGECHDAATAARVMAPAYHSCALLCGRRPRGSLMRLALRAPSPPPAITRAVSS
jgi:hypothetical protein